MGDINSTGNNTLWNEIGTYSADVDVDQDLHTKAKIWDGTNIATVTTDGAKERLDVNTDATTDGDAFVNITARHHQIHLGNHYKITSGTSLGTNNSQEFIITTADTDDFMHFQWIITGSKGFDIDFFEGPTGITGGTSVIPGNNNMNSSNTSASTWLSNPTEITDDGELLLHKEFNLQAVQTHITVNEVVLKRNTTYLSRVTATVAGNTINWDYAWYEAPINISEH